MIGIYPDLTRDYILERITQEKIIIHFVKKHSGIELNLDLSSPGCHLVGRFSSPLRKKDDNPSATFHYNEHGRLRLRDWSIGFWGDCFDVVAYYLNLNSKNKHHFMTVLHVIAREFRIHKYSEISDESLRADNEEHAGSFLYRGKNPNKKKLSVHPRNWHPLDGKYWMGYDIRIPELREAKVVPLAFVWIDDELIYYFNPKENPNDLAYGYFDGLDDNGEQRWRVYLPDRRKGKFIAPRVSLQGLHMLEPSPILLIPKSLKDVIVMRRYTIRGEKLQCVAPHSESTYITDEEFDMFKDMGFKLIFTLFDWDRTGLHFSWLYRKRHGTIPLFIKNPTWNSGIKYQVKDPADYRKTHGVDAAIKLFQSAVDYYKDLIDFAFNEDDFPTF